MIIEETGKSEIHLLVKDGGDSNPDKGPLNVKASSRLVIPVGAPASNGARNHCLVWSRRCDFLVRLCERGRGGKGHLRENGSNMKFACGLEQNTRCCH